jgi:hypothetical protein
MKLALVLIFTTTAVFAQDWFGVPGVRRACGPDGVQFDVKLGPSEHSIATFDAGKALVYIAQDIGIGDPSGPPVTALVGLDGAWVGANEQNSHLSFSVDPGEHHICVRRNMKYGMLSQMIALSHFTAEPGKVYYFRTRIFASGDKYFLDFSPIDSDEGLFLISLGPLSVSRPHK